MIVPQKEAINVDSFSKFLSRLNAIKSHVMETQPDNPVLTLKDLVERLNLVDQAEFFDIKNVEEWISTLSDENRGLWYQKENGVVTFI